MPGWPMGFGERKRAMSAVGPPSEILYIATVDDIGQRADPLPGFVFKPDRTHHLAIDIGGRGDEAASLTIHALALRATNRIVGN